MTISPIPHVHLLVERDRFGNPHGSGQIRLLLPFSHPSLSGLRVTVEDAMPAAGTDVVIVERGWRAACTLEAAAELVHAIRRAGAKFIYTLDDNLLDLHLDAPWREFSTDLKRNIVRYFARQADCVVVSTEPLARRMSRLNRNVRIVMNALDERLFEPPSSWRPRSAGGERAVVGYMGTHSHLEDLMMVLEPLRAVLRESGARLEFQMVGVSADMRVCDCFDALPFRVIDTEGNHFYPDFVPWARSRLQWDFALAPLVASAFNTSKSDIKYLDYALLGIPGIYSDVEAYRGSVEDGVTGLLCPNDIESWGNMLSRLATDAQLRADLAKNAFRRVSETRLLKQRAVDWLNVIEELTGGRWRCSLAR